MSKRIIPLALVGILSAVTFASAETLAERLSGNILLQVQAHGEAWYVDPVELNRVYLKDGAVAYEALREFGLGITNADLDKIPVGVEVRFSDADTDGDGLSDKLEDGLNTIPTVADTDSDGVSDGQEVLVDDTDPLGEGRLTYDQDLADRLTGRILLQVQSHGEAWYIYPKDGKRYYMKDGDAAYQIMRFLSLGITDADLSLVPVSETFGVETPVEEPMVRGTADPDFIVAVYDTSRAQAGTTLLADNHDTDNPRIIEINMLGEIIWEYDLPQELKSYTNPGFDVERLSNGNILFVLPRKGIYEITEDKQIVWSYLTSKVSHDADRLLNGNTIFVYGASDTMNDAQVTEVNAAGAVVWSWYAKDRYATEFAGTNSEGWSHTNAVTRMDNGNTLVSPRNFDRLVEVSPSGEVVREIGASMMHYQHDPAVQANGNILFANHTEQNAMMEIDGSENIVWEFPIADSRMQPARDVDRLPNGNILITGTTKIIEVTPDKEVVWSFGIADASQFTRDTSPSLGFYKAERIVE